MTPATARDRALHHLRQFPKTVLRFVASVPFVLFVCFFATYFNAGQKLRSTPVYDRGDVFFRADTRRAWRDMIGDRTSSHIHTSGHPNFVIFHQPIGYNLGAAIKKHFKGKRNEADQNASIVMTAAAGAGTVVLFYLLLLANGVPVLRSALFSGVLGFSSVGLFYGAVPETYVFSALGLTAVAFLACRRDLGEPWWQLAAVYAWSALTTSIALVGIWAMARHWQKPWFAWVKRVALTVTITVVLVVALNVLQNQIYPKTVLFFQSHSVAKESTWLYWERLQSPVETARLLLQHQWISNVIAPEPEVQFPFGPAAPMASIEAGAWKMFAPALPLFALWCVILLGAIPALADRRFYTPATLAGLGVIAFNFLFFFIFGHDRMLYAALWTSISVFLIAMGWESLIRRLPLFGKVMAPLLIILLAGMAWHNWHFLDKIAVLVK